MGLFSGSSKSTTSTTNNSTINNVTRDERQDNRSYVDNSVVSNIDNRQDNRFYADKRVYNNEDNRQTIDARQDNRQTIDARVITDNSQVTNIDSRQDNRFYADKRVYSTVDSRQDNRQFIDNRQEIDSRSFNDNRQDKRQFYDDRDYSDQSVTVGAGGINAAGAVTINSLDGGVLAEAFEFADSVAESALNTVRELGDELLGQSEASFEETNQNNLMIMAGVGLAAVVGLSLMRA